MKLIFLNFMRACMRKICHITSVHYRYDTRIFLKMCTSLSQKYTTYLVVADGLGNEVKNGVNIIDTGSFLSRKERIFKAPNVVYQKALELDADLYHIHDPELMHIALKLKKQGKCVIYDSHEDFPDQLKSKEYLNKYFAYTLSFLTKFYEKYICSRLSFVVAATPKIRNKFLKFCSNVIDINNYPILGELSSDHKSWSNVNKEIAYIGTISKERGIIELVKALEYTTSEVRLNLVGTFEEIDTYNIVKNLDGWKYVNELGKRNRVEVKEILDKSLLGIVTFLPSPNHTEAQPNKMFEYMSAGIPVLGSFFPLWKDILEGNDCGICIDPESSKEIASVIDKLVADPNFAKVMGERGIQAINEKYNWSIEEIKLFKLYEKLLGN